MADQASVPVSPAVKPAPYLAEGVRVLVRRVPKAVPVGATVTQAKPREVEAEDGSIVLRRGHFLAMTDDGEELQLRDSNEGALWSRP
jgi:hypothetical protein